MRSLVFASALLLIATPAFTQDNMYVGVGKQTCGYWVTARKAGSSDTSAKTLLRESVVTSWVQGFVVGVWAREGGQRASFSVPDGPTMQVWLDKYCADRPLELVMQAAIQLVTEITGPKQ